MLSLQALIIDDNTANIMVLAQLLALEGITSIREPRAQNVVQDLSRFLGVSLIFLDLEMSTNGFELLKLFRSDPRFNRVPVIAYTVHTQLLEEVQDAGFDSLIGKPVDAEEFPRHLASILRGDEVWAIP